MRSRHGWLPAAVMAALCCTGERPGRIEAGPPASASPTASRLADSLYAAAAFEAARDLWRTELAEAWSRGDSARAARLLTSIGLASYNLEDYRDARRDGEAALALKQRLGMRSDLFRSYNALGLLAWAEERLEDAAALFGQARASAEAVGDRLGVAKAMGNMGQVHRDRGEALLAQEGFAALAVVSRELGDSVSLGRALSNLAMADLLLGDPVAALAAAEEARRLARAIGDAVAEENALGQMATAYAALGQPQRALATIDSALMLAEANGLRRRQAEDLKLLGDYYAAAGDHRRALDQYGQAQAVHNDLGLLQEQGSTMRDEARSYRALGHADSAQARARRALAIHRLGGFRAAEFDDLLLLADLAGDRGDGEGAAAVLRQAGGLAREMGTPLPVARAAIGSARAHDRFERSEAVLAALDSANQSVGLLPEDERWEPDALRARAYARLGRLDAAEGAGRRATSVIEGIRAGYGSGALRTSYLAGRAAVYADLVVVLLAAGRTEAAFEVADAARGRALLEHLIAARREVEGGAGPTGDLMRGELLLRRIDELTAQLRRLADEPQGERGAGELTRTRSLEDRLAEARAEYEALMSRLAAGPTGEATLLGAARMRVAEVQRSLRPGELLVEYFVGPDRLHLFALSPSRLHHLSQPVPAGQVASRVRLARELAARPDLPEASDAVLEELYRLLVEPLDTLVPLDSVGRLVMVPHGPLVYLPFAALRNREGGPLVQQHAVMVLPSAASLTALRSRATSRAGQTRRVAVAVAPLPSELPASRTEAADVRRALRGRALIGRSAGEAAVRKALARADVVHFATHGILNPVNPMFSRLELAPGTSGRSQDDGRLEVHELLGLRITAGLVFLSGCETGRGAAWRTGFEQGEDYVTLGQAVLYAGAANVVATLWRVDDPAAAAFAARFYRALEGGDVVEALAEAQRSMLSQPAYRAPYYWAGYQVSGSGTL